MTDIDRNSYIGSSDAKAILDGDWHRLWMEKTGRAQREDLSDKFKVQLGVFTEGFHLDWIVPRMIAAGEIAAEVEGGRQREFRPEGYPYVASHVDAVFLLPPMYVPTADVAIPRGEIPVDAKHSSGKRSTEELVDFYMPQLQHHIWCAGSERALFSVIQGNEEPERVWIGRSQEWIDLYAAACVDFWKHVLEDTAPNMGSAAAAAEIVTPKVRDAIPINGMTKRCMDGNNLFKAVVREVLDNEAAAKKYDKAKADLKAMMEPGEAELYSKIATLKRDKRGAIRITFHEEAAA